LKELHRNFGSIINLRHSHEGRKGIAESNLFEIDIVRGVQAVTETDPGVIEDSISTIITPLTLE